MVTIPVALITVWRAWSKACVTLHEPMASHRAPASLPELISLLGLVLVPPQLLVFAPNPVAVPDQAATSQVVLKSQELEGNGRRGRGKWAN